MAQLHQKVDKKNESRIGSIKHTNTEWEMRVVQRYEKEHREKMCEKEGGWKVGSCDNKPFALTHFLAFAILKTNSI